MGRPGARLRAHVLPSGRRQDGIDFTIRAPSDAARFAELAQQAVNDGFTAFKCMAVPETAAASKGLQPIRYAEACVAAMRDAVGESIDIMVDCHARPSPRMGVLFAQALEPFGLYFFEEPCWPESVDGLAEMQRSVDTPIATGERLVGLHAFRELLEKRGLQRLAARHHALRRIERSAADRGAGRGLSRGAGAAQPARPGEHRGELEFGFATPSYIICETVHLDVPWRQRRGPRRLRRRAEGPHRPAEHASWAWASRSTKTKSAAIRFSRSCCSASFYPDGAVGDW